MSRMLGLFNKRYLTLDMKQLLFFYGASENANFQKAKIIRLQTINRILIDPNLDFLPPKESWRWGLILNTNEKNYRFMFCDKTLYDNFLIAFSCIHRSDTNKTLYEIPKNEFIYGDLTTDRNQMQLKTQPDLPNIMQTEFQESSSSNQLDTNSDHTNINNLRSEQNLSREEERIPVNNGNGIISDSNGSHIQNDFSEPKIEQPAKNVSKKPARRNSFFENNANQQPTSSSSIPSTQSSIQEKDPSLPKPPTKSKAKPVEEPQEEVKQKVEKDSFKFKQEQSPLANSAKVESYTNLESSHNYPPPKKEVHRRDEEEIESPEPMPEIITDKYHPKPRIGSFDERDEEVFGKQSRTYFNSKAESNNFNLYGIEEPQEKKPVNKHNEIEDMVKNFRPGSGHSSSRSAFDEPTPKKNERSQFDSKSSLSKPTTPNKINASGSKASNGWDDLDQEENQWESKNNSKSKLVNENKKNLWGDDDDDDIAEPTKDVKPINNNYSQNLKQTTPSTSTYQPNSYQPSQNSKNQEEDEDDWDAGVYGSPKKPAQSSTSFSKPSENFNQYNSVKPTKSDSYSSKPINISPPENKPTFKRNYPASNSNSNKDIKTIPKEESPVKKPNKGGDDILDDWD